MHTVMQPFFAAKKLYHQKNYFQWPSFVRRQRESQSFVCFIEINENFSPFTTLVSLELMRRQSVQKLVRYNYAEARRNLNVLLFQVEPHGLYTMTKGLKGGPLTTRLKQKKSPDL